MSEPIIELKTAIEEIIGWSRTAIRLAVDECGGGGGEWPAMGALADQIGEIERLAEKLLPLHPEIEAAFQDEWHRFDAFDPPEALGR